VYTESCLHPFPAFPPNNVRTLHIRGIWTTWATTPGGARVTQGGPRRPRKAQGDPARTQTTKTGGPGNPSKGAPRDAQGVPERSREAQGGPGRPKEAQGGPGRPSTNTNTKVGRPREPQQGCTQGRPGRPREPQGGPGSPREPQGGPRESQGRPRDTQGGPRRPRDAQQKKHSQGRGHRWPLCRHRTADNRREPLQPLNIPHVWDIYQIHHRFGVGKTLVNFVNVNIT
jgi:hypothetical protein